MSTNNRHEINKTWRKIQDIEVRLMTEELSDEKYDFLNSKIKSLSERYETLIGEDDAYLEEEN